MSSRLAVQPAASYESADERPTLSSDGRSADTLDNIEQRLRDRVGRKIHELRLQVENPNRPKRFSATDMPIICERLNELPVFATAANTQRRSSSYQSVITTSLPFTSRCRSSVIISGHQRAPLMTSCNGCLTSSSSCDDFKTPTVSERFPVRAESIDDVRRRPTASLVGRMNLRALSVPSAAAENFVESDIGDVTTTTTTLPKQSSILSSARLVASYANTVKIFNTECRDRRLISDDGDDVKTDEAMIVNDVKNDVEHSTADIDGVIEAEGSRTIEVTIEKGVLGLGFCVDGGTDAPAGPAPISVKRLFKGDTAAKGHLQAGDAILSVNEHSFVGISHFDAWNILKKLPNGLVRCVIRRKLNRVDCS